MGAEKKIMNDEGARKLIAAVLKQAYTDYVGGEKCPLDCEYKHSCEEKNKVDKQYCEARQFIHSAWAAALCEGIDIDHQKYVKACIEKHRLTKNTYRYVENEIKNYKSTVKELERLKKDIILESPIQQEVRGTETSDPTVNKMLKISLDRKIVETEKTVKAIEKIHRALSGNQKVVMEEYWIGRYTTPGLAAKMGVDETTVRRWKKYIVYSVAIELKYL